MGEVLEAKWAAQESQFVAIVSWLRPPSPPPPATPPGCYATPPSGSCCLHIDTCRCNSTCSLVALCQLNPYYVLNISRNTARRAVNKISPTWGMICMQEASGIHLERKECGLKRGKCCFRITTSAHNYKLLGGARNWNKELFILLWRLFVDSKIVFKQHG